MNWQQIFFFPFHHLVYHHQNHFAHILVFFQLRNAIALVEHEWSKKTINKKSKKIAIIVNYVHHVVSLLCGTVLFVILFVASRTRFISVSIGVWIACARHFILHITTSEHQTQVKIVKSIFSGKSLLCFIFASIYLRTLKW